MYRLVNQIAFLDYSRTLYIRLNLTNDKIMLQLPYHYIRR